MFSLDRIVNDKAVIVDKQGNSIHVDINLLPKDVKEGDVLLQNNHAFIVDKELTKQKQDKMQKMLNKITKKAK